MSFDLPTEALKASGINKAAEIIAYRHKLDQIFQAFLLTAKPLQSDPIKRAKQLFRWLWDKKPFRYQIHGPFKLSDCILAQLNNRSRHVGNCLGLTLLYNCLLEKMELVPGALYLETAFDHGPHVLSILKLNDITIDIENICAHGFNYGNHINHPSRVMWGAKELVSDVYFSVGNGCLKKHELSQALENYNRALHYNPAYRQAHMNRAIAEGMLRQSADETNDS